MRIHSANAARSWSMRTQNCSTRVVALLGVTSTKGSDNIDMGNLRGAVVNCILTKFQSGEYYLSFNVREVVCQKNSIHQLAPPIIICRQYSRPAPQCVLGRFAIRKKRWTLYYCKACSTLWNLNWQLYQNFPHVGKWRPQTPQGSERILVAVHHRATRHVST